jgi:outer membrane protein TolC
VPDRVGRFYTNDLTFEVVQPLLKDAWPTVNLAEVRVARLDHKISLSKFHEQVEQTIFEVISAYYRLIQARTEVEIAERLLDNAAKTFERVERRKKLDATVVNIKQAEAALERRKAILENARNALGDARDQLVRLIPDATFNLLDEFEIIPLTDMTDIRMRVDVTDRLLTALNKNPSLRQVRWALKQADIGIDVAENQIMPSLNIKAGTTIHGGSTRSRERAWRDFSSGHFASYWASLEFEYPLGNRAALAALSESRVRRLQAVSQLQNISDLIAQAVRERARQVETSYRQLVAQKRAADAVRKQLDGIIELETTRATLTPEFLNLKLGTQEDLARAESDALRALVDYNIALVELDKVTGILLNRSRVRIALPIIVGGGDDD